METKASRLIKLIDHPVARPVASAAAILTAVAPARQAAQLPAFQQHWQEPPHQQQQAQLQQWEGPQQPAQQQQPQRPQRCKVTVEYVPSKLEQQWFDHVHVWQNSFCRHLHTLESSTSAWLRGLAAHTQLQQQPLPAGQSPAQVLAEHRLISSDVFSSFNTRFDCGTDNTTQLTTWIEPLSHGLRHPNALCRRGADIMDRSHLLLTHASEVDAARQQHGGCRGRTCQAIYFDLGATTLAAGSQEAGQGWFFHAYHQQGITFDRFLLWEAAAQTPADIFKYVPKADMHKYQYFNIPVTSATEDPSHPVSMLKTIAQPGDFVVFKLDIDNFRIEHAIVDALLAEPDTLALIDEFFFEEHVGFREMLPYWLDTVGPGTTLASSYAMFHQLRSRGLRAHSWV